MPPKLYAHEMDMPKGGVNYPNKMMLAAKALGAEREDPSEIAKEYDERATQASIAEDRTGAGRGGQGGPSAQERKTWMQIKALRDNK